MNPGEEDDADNSLLEKLRRIKEKKAFFGFNDEFGIKGSITKKSFPNYFSKLEDTKNINYKEFFNDYLKKNFKVNK